MACNNIFAIAGFCWNMLRVGKGCGGRSLQAHCLAECMKQGAGRVLKTPPNMHSVDLCSNNYMYH